MIPQKAWNKLQHGNTVEIDGTVYTPDMVMGKPRKGLKVTYCTDTRPVTAIIENAKHSDLFICEGMYGEEDKDSKAKENKHMTFSNIFCIPRIYSCGLTSDGLKCVSHISATSASFASAAASENVMCLFSFALLSLSSSPYIPSHINKWL